MWGEVGLFHPDLSLASFYVEPRPFLLRNMTKADIIRAIIELKDYTYTHDEMMRMTKKQLIDHFYRLADPTRKK